MRGRDRRRNAQQRPVPEGRRPPGIGHPPAFEWGFFGVCLIVLAAGVGDVGPGWVRWVLRGAGALLVIGFVVARVRYRMRRGEAVWLWNRI